MKKPILFIVSSLLATYIQAQEPTLILDDFATTESMTETMLPSKKGTKWHFGITAGYQHSGIEWVKSSGTVNYYMSMNTQSKPGFTVGGNASLPLNDIFSFDTGLSLSLWRFGYNEPGTVIEASRYVLEIPAVFTFFEPDALVPIFIQLGMVGGICPGNTKKISGSNWDESSYPANDIFAKATFGIVMGIGYGPVSVRYTQNVTSTMSENFKRSWYHNTGTTLKENTSWAVNATYTYWF